MNVKKMFASLAGVLMLAQVVAPMVTGAATYSDELQGAYDYAYSQGITTMSSIDNANMYGDLTRGQLSKMISQWAEKEMGVAVDETAVCSFTDTDKAEGDLGTYVVKACKMGLMGQGIEKFRPGDKVTRGEFGTVLSRAIWGDKYNSENPFYAKHLQALKDAGIMNNISDPNATEMRGWVMLMLQRAAENVNPSECNDPAVLLACALSSDSCPAACTDEAQKAQQDKENGVNPYEGIQAGDLNIAVSTSTSTVSIPNDGVIKVAELSVKATENIQLQSLDVTRLGLSENSGVKVWIEKDGRRITSSSSFFGDSKANLTFNNGGYVVNGDETLDLVVSLSSVDAGSELQFKVSNVVASAKNITVSPDTTGTFRTAKYSATSISFIALTNNPRSYNLAKDSSFSFGEFKLQNDSSASMEKDVMIKSITFKVEGSVENLSNMKLLRDGKEVSSKYTVDGKSVTFAVNDQLDSGKSATYKITATPTVVENSVDQNGDKYTFSIKKDSDVIAEEIGQNATAYRVSVKNIGVVALNTTTIIGGNITLTRDTSLASTINADWGYSDVVIAKGTIKVNQAVKFEDGLTVKKGTTVNAPTTATYSDAIRRAALVIDGKTYQATKINADDIVFGSEIYLSKGDHNVELQVSLTSSAQKVFGTTTTDVTSGGTIPAGSKITATNIAGLTVGTVLSADRALVTGDTASYVVSEEISKLRFDPISKDSFTKGAYQNGDETAFSTTQIAGNIRISDVNIASQKMSIKKSAPSEDVKIVKGNTDEKVLFAGEIQNTTDKVFDLSQFVVKPDGVTNVTAGKKLGDVSIVLTADGSASSTVAINNDSNEYTIDSISKTLEPGESVKFEVRLIPNADLVANDSFRLKVRGKGTLGGNTVETTQLNSVYLRVNANATATVVAASNAKNKVILPGKSEEIASFNYNVKNDSVDVSSIELSGNIAVGDLDDVTVAFGNETPAVESVTVSANVVTVKFANLVTLSEKNYKVTVYGTFSEGAITSTTNGKKIIDDVKVNDNVTSDHKATTYSHWVARAYPLLSVKEKNTSSGNERLDIKVRSNSDDYKVVVDQILASTGGAMTGDLFKKTSGTAGLFKNVQLSADADEVARSNTAKTAVYYVDFTVTNDDGTTVSYTNVNADNIADFASLSL